MDRHQEILELLETVRIDISEISEAYDKARRDEDLAVILRPKIKSCLENLRSCLEYSAQDIWRSYTKKKNSVYFPYGKTEHLFQCSVKKNLPALQARAPKIYELILSLQPFAGGGEWLGNLCKYTNFNKHNGLSPQVRKNSTLSTTSFGSMIRAEGAVTVVMKGCTYNGIPISKSGALTISPDKRVSEISEDINIPVSITREFDWVRFELDDSITDVRELIIESYSRVSDYVSDLSKII